MSDSDRIGAVLPLHFGALHPFESTLALILAGAPFLVLMLVIVVRRRHDLEEEEAAVAVVDDESTDRQP